MRTYKILNGTTASVTLLIPLFALLFVLYWPGLDAELFSIDDDSLFVIPQIQNVGWNSIKAILTPGTHVDYYPVRDFSYLIDRILFGDSWSMMRVHQVLVLCFVAVLIFQIFLKLGIALPLALGLTYLWTLHPYHVEMTLWLSGRKDLLAMMFAMLAFLLGFHPGSSKRFVVALLFFVLSLGSKASFTLLPLALVIPAWWLGKNRRLVVVAGLIGLGAALLQKWFYTSVNSMSADWPFDQRLEMSAAALGRMIVGWINPGVNAIDADNFGQWLSLNQSYEPLGYFAWIALIAGTFVNFRRKDPLGLSLILVIGALYVPTSGLVFRHVNFYSLRYFEPVGLAFLFFGGTLLNPYFEKYKRVFVSVFAIVAVLEIYGTQVEAKTWSDNISIRQKALRVSPDSVSLKSALLGDLISKKVGPNDEKPNFKDLRNNLAELCESQGAQERIWFPNCHNYFRFGYLVSRGANIDRALFYLKLFAASRRIFSPPPRIVELLEADFAVWSGRVTGEMISHWTRDGLYFPMEDYRFLHLIFSCLNSEKAGKAQQQFIDWLSDGLILEEHFREFLKSINPKIRGQTELCFPRVASYQ